MSLRLISKKTEQIEQSTILLGSIKEVRTQGKPLFPRLERQANTDSRGLPEQGLTRGTTGGTNPETGKL